ncbi:MAG TPA: hypothetical protein VLX44_10230 [Xanthobacteraceae bacterium]|nr:hypothetical protein [Xanthobacteraceae bacterium]
MTPHPETEREADLRALAHRLQFAVERTGDHFRLTRTAGVSRPVREEGLTLREAEDLLATRKLRGPHGG